MFSTLQYLIPQQLLTKCCGKLAASQKPWLKNFLIKRFIHHYQVDMSIALESDPTQYADFNAFFTRQLKPTARPLATAANHIISPADGTISEFGNITEDRLLQAKGMDYSLFELLAGDGKLTKLFTDGSFLTIYLSPRDYHRVHMPIAGQLEQMVHVPGKLFSVCQRNAENIPRLFARNERVISTFKTKLGACAVIMVGALNVGSINTKWAGQISPPHSQQVRHYQYAKDADMRYPRGAEMGYFKLGSTVILLFEHQAIEWQSELQVGQSIKLGEAIATPKTSYDPT